MWWSIGKCVNVLETWWTFANIWETVDVFYCFFLMIWTYSTLGQSNMAGWLEVNSSTHGRFPSESFGSWPIMILIFQSYVKLQEGLSPKNRTYFIEKTQPGNQTWLESHWTKLRIFNCHVWFLETRWNIEKRWDVFSGFEYMMESWNENFRFLLWIMKMEC